jgi:hypothetical protein
LLGIVNNGRILVKFTKPSITDVFTITSSPAWPNVVFATDATGLHSWRWSIQWAEFKKSGTAQTPANLWDAQSVVINCGGSLTVSATAGGNSVSITIKIKAANPSDTEVNAYLATKLGSGGFDKLLKHESGFKNFNTQGEPIKSFDNGYGMCQLTSPSPTLAQMWNWKLNIDGGLALFAQKRDAAIKYLSQNNRTYSDDQVNREAVCRWNGGPYHLWDSRAGNWIRNPNILCDSATGNIGWDMTDSENSGKTEADLHKRDCGYYSKPPTSGAHWKYSGVCYADAILG